MIRMIPLNQCLFAMKQEKKKLVEGIRNIAAATAAAFAVISRLNRIFQSPHPAAQPAASSTVIHLSLTNRPNRMLHFSASRQAKRCLHTGGISSPRVAPPKIQAWSCTVSLFSSLSSSSLSWLARGMEGDSVVAGKAAKVKAGQEQDQVVRRTW